MAYQPKSYRKFLAGAVTTAVVASSFAGVAGAAANFNDVNDNYKEAVDYLVSKGISGISATEFGTYQNIKRVDAAVFVVKALGLDVDAAPASGFTDVPERAVKEVNALKAAGITSGKSATEFGAQDLITRGELAIWLTKAFELQGTGDISAFTDVSGIYTDAVKTLVANDITKGTSATTFGTKDPAKRGDFAVFVKKSVDASKEEVKTPTVKSVSAINAKTLEIKFNTAFDPSNTGTGALNPANYSIDGDALGANGSNHDFSTVTLEKSSDNKTITVKFGANFSLANDTSYALVIDGVKAIDKVEDIALYTGAIYFNDTERPVVNSVNYKDNVTAKVNFSEVMASLGTVTIYNDKDEDVTSDFSIGALSADGKSFEIGMTSANVLNNVNYKVEIVGASDLAGNILNPTTYTTTIKKNVEETVAPKITSIEAVDSNTVKVKYSEKVTDPGTLSVDGATPFAIDTDPKDGNATVDSTGLVYTVDLDATNAAAITADGVYTVTVADFIDLNGNTTASESKAVSFVQDSTGPAFESSQVVDIAGTKYLVLTFDELANAGSFIKTAADLTGTYVDSDGIESAATITATGGEITEYNPEGKSTVTAVKIDLTGVATGTYTVDIPANLVQDNLTNGNKLKEITFNLGSNVADSTKPEINTLNFQTVDNNTVSVVFTESVDKNSALSLNNYLVDGVAAFKKVVFDTNTSTVKLTLNDDAIKTSGNHLFTVQGVKDLAGNVIKTDNRTVVATENVTPKISKAELIGANKIKVTFSEAVTAANVTAADLDVFVGTTKEDETAPFAVAQAGAGTTDKEFIITLGDDLTSVELTKDITVKAVVEAGNEIADANLNAVKAHTVTVTK